MSREKKLVGDFELFSSKITDGVVVLNIYKDILSRATDLKSKEILLKFMDRISESDAIRAVVVISPPDKRGRDEYIELFSGLLESKLNRDDLIRIFNAVNQVILRIRGLNKIVIHATGGAVIMMFLGISLACDYRIVASNTVFQNPCLELGLVPKGGGPFFITKMLGMKAAYDILLSGCDFTASEALNLGLVNKVVPPEDIEAAALRAARFFSQIPTWTLAGFKNLINYSLNDLAEYLEYENHELIKIIDSGKIRERRPEKWSAGVAGVLANGAEETIVGTV